MTLAGESLVVLLDEVERLYVDHEGQFVDHLLTEFLKESLGHEDGLAFRVIDDVCDLAFRRIRQDWHGHTSERHAREHRNRPVGHVVGKDGYLVPRADPESVEPV